MVAANWFRPPFASTLSGDLLDAQGMKVLDDDGKPRDGDELRVKYFTGPAPAMRYREMFTETVVSRLFWALGIPVDRVYMPASVRCVGCSADPFGQKVASPSLTPQLFTLASVERPYDGKTISITRSKWFLGLGGRYNHGFGFDEIGSILPDLAPSRRVEAEVMAIALNLVAYSNTHSYQNDLVCRKGGWDKATGECSDVVAFVSDVGGALGGENGLVGRGDAGARDEAISTRRFHDVLTWKRVHRPDRLHAALPHRFHSHRVGSLAASHGCAHSGTNRTRAAPDHLPGGEHSSHGGASQRRGGSAVQLAARSRAGSRRAAALGG